MIKNRNYAGEYLYYLPWYDQENILFIDIARCVDLIFRLLGDKLSIIERNLFLDTVVEIIPILTRDLGLTLPKDITVEQKRDLIQSYLHYLHKQTTEQVVQDLLNGYTSQKSLAALEKGQDQDTYKIFLGALDDKENFRLDLIVGMLKKVLPAHLAFSLEVGMIKDLRLTTYYGDFTFSSYLCGEELCGDIPWEIKADNKVYTIKAETGVYHGHNDYPMPGDYHYAGEVYDDKVDETIFMQDFDSKDTYSFTD